MTSPQVLVTHFIWGQKIKCLGHRVNKCNVGIVVATNKLQALSPEGATVSVEYSRNSM